MKKIRIEKLLKEAKNAMLNAYAPYSKLKVGAAILTKKGNIYTGCNVENASYGLTVCAERNAISNAVLHNEKNFEAIAVITNSKYLRTPCGACRQVIYEFSKDVEIIISNSKGKIKKTNIKELLPKSFKI